MDQVPICYPSNDDIVYSSTPEGLFSQDEAIVLSYLASISLSYLITLSVLPSTKPEGSSAQEKDHAEERTNEQLLIDGSGGHRFQRVV
jgi:hypothetical protein